MIQSHDCLKSHSIKATTRVACLVAATCSQCQRLQSQVIRLWTLWEMQAVMSWRFRYLMTQIVEWASLYSMERRELARSAMSCSGTQMTWSLIFKESHKTLKARAIIKAEKTSQRLSLSAELTSRLVDTVLIQLRSPPRTSLKGLNLIADRVSQQSVIRARLRQALQSSTRDTKLWLEAPWVKSKLSYQMISWTTVAQMSVAITERAIMDRLSRLRLQKWQYRM